MPALQGWLQETVKADQEGLTLKADCANFMPWQRSSVVEQGTHKPLVTGSNPVAATTKHKSASIDQGTGQNPQTYTLWLKNGGDSLMLQRLLGHTTLMMTNRYCQAVGCYDAVESHKKYSPVDRLIH